MLKLFETNKATTILAFLLKYRSTKEKMSASPPPQVPISLEPFEHWRPNEAVCIWTCFSCTFTEDIFLNCKMIFFYLKVYKMCWNINLCFLKGLHTACMLYKRWIEELRNLLLAVAADCFCTLLINEIYAVISFLSTKPPSPTHKHFT